MEAFAPVKAKSAREEASPSAWQRTVSCASAAAIGIAFALLLGGAVPPHAVHDSLSHTGATWLIYAGSVVDCSLHPFSGLLSERIPAISQWLSPISQGLALNIYLGALATATVLFLLPACAEVIGRGQQHDIVSW